ncbi:protein regulator of cytokinesis 1-like [Tropilaelaps mercedesae]|uniref:Protein regulator of cytokinesis 1-like n=1 Tax=Tropilaelaps mercedesae TaxID=418985 RepID=A0A1V9XPT6_9ACAR|nr:protein regulator of cytokinesis 1-like [Tropilaelaps mercedesae]
MTPSKLNLVPLKYKDTYIEYMDTCAENVLRLQDIWENCGIPDEKIYKRMMQLFQWINERWTTVINDELQAVEEQKVRVQTALDELAELCSQLEVELPRQPAGLNLQQQLDWVESSSSTVEEIRSQRETLYAALRAQESELVATMSDTHAWEMPRKATPRGVIRTLPNDENLRELTSHVKMLREERRIRLDKLQPLVEASCTLMERMGKVPRLPIEEELSSVPAERWNLSQANIQRVIEARDALSLEETHLHARHTAKITQLGKLFDRLDVTQAERNELLEGLTHVKTYQSVARLEELVAEYEELKRANMAIYVDKLRGEAKQWHAALRIGGEWQEPADIQNTMQKGLSEDLIADYERIIGTLKAKHDRLVPLFKLLDEREQLMEMLREVEESQKDPNRFKNRGGALLQETKKRDRVNKNLPIVAKQIIKFLDAYEPENGPVIVNGKSVRAETRQGDEKRPRSVSATYATPLKASNRPLHTTPATAMPASQLRTRSAMLKRAGTYTEIKPKISTLRQTPSIKSQTVGKVYTRQMTMKSPSSNAKNKLSAVKRGIRRSMSYGDFETQLSSTDEMHSTRIIKHTNERETRSKSRKLIF